MHISERADFDSRSGNPIERLIFNNRIWVILACVLVTAVLAFQAASVKVGANFLKVIPQSHPYIQNYLQYKGDLPQLGNSIRVVVENVDGDIFDPAFLESFRQINDKLYLVPGVDRGWMKSIWMAAVRWREVTDEGFEAGPVMPGDFDSSPRSIDNLRRNINRAGLVGSLVANNMKSSMIVLPLVDNDPQTGKPLDYRKLSHTLEELRTAQLPNVKMHIVGFAKLSGDLIDGVVEVMRYFALAAAITAAIILLYTRCLRSTMVVLTCSVIAVLWQLGIVAMMGYDLDPYSVLVPFLVFAIGVSHGAQKMNGIVLDVGRGVHKYVAARYTFRRLFLAGLTALIADAVGFAVLMVIDIPVIKDLALTASVGVAVLVFTNLILLPVLLSYIGVSEKAAQRTLREESDPGAKRTGLGRLWALLDGFTTRRYAMPIVIASVVLSAVGFLVSQKLAIGDLQQGAPELRADSRYNRDNAFITANYGLSSDQFAVIVATPRDGCGQYATLLQMDRLATQLRELEGVQTTESLDAATRLGIAGGFEGFPKWQTLLRDQTVLDNASYQAGLSNPGLANSDCSVAPVVAYLADHKAETLNRVLETVETFGKEHNTDELKFLPAAGSAGIEAVTNIVVKQAWTQMLIYVYAAVAVLCLITFRSWRATIVAILPLMMTSILCEALMVALGIGVKVATLPVIALGVGIGVDYALYLLSVQLAHQRAGASLRDAYRSAVQFTGKVVGLIGVSLSVAVLTWGGSPIKFQADMGILLTFMFLWNMIGALVLIPALSHFLLRNVGGPVSIDDVEADLRSRTIGKDSAHEVKAASDTVAARGGKEPSSATVVSVDAFKEAAQGAQAT